MVSKFIISVTHAVEGLGVVLKGHSNFRIHLGLAVIATVLARSLEFTTFEYAILTITILLVVMAEIVNTAIEELSDLVTVRWSKHAKVAKDIGAGMVLVVSIGAAIIGWLLFIPKFY